MSFRLPSLRLFRWLRASGFPEKAAQGKGSRHLDPFGQTPSLQPG